MDSSRSRRLVVRVALLGGGVAAGAVIASAVAANAATARTGSTATTAAAVTSSTTSPSNPAGSSNSSNPPNGTRKANGQPLANQHGSQPVRSDEKAVSSTLAAQLKAAALKAVPGGTVYRVETDSGDATYEAHMTKSDGTDVTVKFDKNLTVTGVETGMGK